MTLAMESPSREFDDDLPEHDVAVLTVRTDSTRAELSVAGDLDADSGALIRHVVNGHVQARRRFLRADLSAVTSVDTDGIVALVEVHRQLLAERGTLILVNVGEQLRAEFATSGLADELFVLAPTADRLLAPAVGHPLG